MISQIALNDFGETFFSFSYPWGKHTDREVSAVKAAGYECAVTVGEIINLFRVNPYRLGRLIMRRGMDLDSFRRIIAGPTWSQRIPIRIQTLVRRVQGRVFPGK